MHNKAIKNFYIVDLYANECIDVWRDPLIYLHYLKIIF